MSIKNLTKLVKILDLLSRPQGATKKEIETELDASGRTVTRLLADIQDMDFPVYDDREDGAREKRWYLEPSYVKKLPNIAIPDIFLNAPEIISLFMLKGEGNVFQGTEIEKQINRAFQKLLGFIPEEMHAQFKTLKRITLSKSINSKSYKGREDTIRVLTECILNQNICRITYHTFYKDEVKGTDIGPLHFYEENRGLYVFALDLIIDEVKSYAVERIKRIRPFEKTFDYPETFNPEERLNSAFHMTHGDPVTVKIRFSKTVAKYIRERIWSKEQTQTEDPDGSVTLSMTTSGKGDVKRWVMSYGQDAEILKPEEMKQEIISDLQKILKKYLE